MASEFPQRSGRLDCELLYAYTLLYFTFSAYVEAVREGNHAPFRSTRVDDDGVGQTDRRTAALLNAASRWAGA